MTDTIDYNVGPPMLPHDPSRPLKRKRRKVLQSDSPLLNTYTPRNIQDLHGADHLIASELPEGFPENLAFRALAAYAFLRTMSRELQLSPFTPNVFLRALNLPYPSRLIGQVHVALLRHLLASMGYTYRPRGSSLAKKRKVDGLRWEVRAGDNLAYLDTYTWPLFYDDYVHLTADILYERSHDTTNHLDYRSLALQDDNGDYIPSDPDDGENEVKEKSADVTPAKVARGRGFGLPTKRGRPSSSQMRPTTKSMTPSFQPNPKKLKRDTTGGSGSEASRQSDDTDTEDEDFAPQPQGGGVRGIPRKLPSSAILPQPVMRPPEIAWSSHTKRTEDSVASTYSHSGTMDNHKFPHMAYTLASYVEQADPASNYPRENFPSTNQSLASSTFVEKPNFLIMHPLHTAAGSTIEHNHPSSHKQIPLQAHTGPGFSSENMMMMKRSHAFTPSAAFPKTKSETGQAGAKFSSESKQNIQKPRPWTRAPVMKHLPRPGMPTAVPYMANRPEIRAPIFTKVSSKLVKPRAICVADDIADALDKFRSSASSLIPPKSGVGTKDVNTIDSENSSKFDPWRGNVKSNEWPQFAPLKKMRKGIPYHRLPVVQKINVLEFLIDELLALDYIAAEFSRRQIIANCSSHSFGSLPTKEELEQLENDDECGICGFEGDLLCCDGCPSSYHRRCIAMDEMSRLPEGAWLCPECRLKDPSIFGSLRGDRKASVDWFSVQDLLNRAENGQQINYQAGIQVAINEGLLNKSLLSNHESNCQHRAVEGSFMIIHGFVFSRPLLSCGLGLLNASRSGSLSYNVLKLIELFPLLQRLGQALASQWPLAQIPMNQSEVWNCLDPRTDCISIVQYFEAEESFDPSKYRNLYGCAPLAGTLKTCVTPKDVYLVAKDYEHMCYHAETRMLSCHLKADMSCDKSLLSALRLGTNIFSPYAMIAGYLQKLEAALSKAWLLSDFWGLQNRSGQLDAWSRRATSCRSINRLSKRLVTLVDAAHPLAFHEDWFLPQGARPARATRDDLNVDDKKTNRSLTEDWTPAKEKSLRRWEQCAESNVLSLLAADSKTLAEFVDGARLQVRFTGRKRKGIKIGFVLPLEQDHIANATERSDFEIRSTPVEQEVKMTLNPECQVLEGTGETSEQVQCLNGGNSEAVYSELSTSLGTETISSEDAARSRRRRRQSREGTDENGKGVVAAVDTVLDKMRASKIKEIEALISQPMEKEQNWAVCGRFFFDPVAYISPAEMRYLGRNAGTVRAAHITYNNAFEVGQGSACHVWRKRCLDCESWESLILLIRELRAHLDDISLISCETAVRRYGGSKASLQKSIMASTRDLSSGELCYFVYHESRRRGFWVPSSKIDPASYAVERDKRRVNMQIKRQREVLEEKVRLHIIAEKKAVEENAAALAVALAAKEKDTKQLVASTSNGKIQKPPARRIQAKKKRPLVQLTDSNRKVPMVAAQAIPRNGQQSTISTGYVQARSIMPSITARRIEGDPQGQISEIAINGPANIAPTHYDQATGRLIMPSITAQTTEASSLGKLSQIARIGPASNAPIHFVHARSMMPLIAAPRTDTNSQGQLSSIAACGAVYGGRASVQSQNLTTNTTLERERDVQQLRFKMESTLRMHKAETGQLLMQCMNSGLHSISKQAMFDLRSKNLAELYKANAQMGLLQGPGMSEDTLKTMLLETETMAKHSFEADVAAARVEYQDVRMTQRFQSQQNQYRTSYHKMLPNSHAPQAITRIQAAPVSFTHVDHSSHSHAFGHGHQMPSNQQGNLGSSFGPREEPNTNTRTPFYQPKHVNPNSWSTQRTQEPINHPYQPSHAHQSFDASVQEYQGIHTQQHLPHQHVVRHQQRPATSMQPQQQLLFQPNKQFYQQAHGENLAQSRQMSQWREQFDFDPTTTELDLQSGPLNDISRFDPQQWT